jgi:hypothetical protein
LCPRVLVSRPRVGVLRCDGVTGGRRRKRQFGSCRRVAPRLPRFMGRWDARGQREANVNIHGLQNDHDRAKCLEEDGFQPAGIRPFPPRLPVRFPILCPISFFRGVQSWIAALSRGAHTKRGPCRDSCQGPSATISPNSQRRLSKSHLVGSEFQGLVVCFVQFSISPGTCDWGVRRPMSL